jgi:beta-phosphoglucomutase-like phosphatase (HAD superfamily)
MHAFDLVIFDCDGVLVDSEPITNVVFAPLGFVEDYRGRSARALHEPAGRRPRDSRCNRDAHDSLLRRIERRP